MPETRLPPYEAREVILTKDLEARSNWAFQSFRIQELWKHTAGKNVKVCVLDNGYLHKDIKITKKKDFSGEGFSLIDGHGIWCSGCIEAKEGFLGIAPECKLYAGKILTSHGLGQWDWMKKGLEWADEEDCQVVSISAGGPYYGNEIQPILKKLRDKGVLIICAAGNENNKLLFPSNSPDTLAVGAVDKDWQRASFSNYGPRLIIMAPGVDLLGCWKNNGYALLSGTSMACPIISGVATLEYALRPMNLDQALERFEQTSKDMEKPGWDEKTGWGIVQPDKFLKIEVANGTMKLLKCKEHDEIFKIETDEKCWIQNWDTFLFIAEEAELSWQELLAQVEIIPFEDLRDNYPVGETMIKKTITTIVAGKKPKEIFYKD